MVILKINFKINKLRVLNYKPKVTPYQRKTRVGFAGMGLLYLVISG
jgi:hypothetical protein